MYIGVALPHEATHSCSPKLWRQILWTSQTTTALMHHTVICCIFWKHDHQRTMRYA